MKRITFLLAALIVTASACGNGSSSDLKQDTSQHRTDTFNKRKQDTQYSPDSTNQPHGPDKQ